MSLSITVVGYCRTGTVSQLNTCIYEGRTLRSNNIRRELQGKFLELSKLVRVLQIAQKFIIYHFTSWQQDRPDIKEINIISIGFGDVKEFQIDQFL